MEFEADTIAELRQGVYELQRKTNERALMALNPAGHPIDPGRVAHHALRSDDVTVAAVRLREADSILIDVAFGRARNKEGWLDRAAVLIREAQLIVDIERGALEIE